MVIPLSAAEIIGLLGRAPDYGPLDDPSRRASCLGGLGYPASTQVLGARPIEINARPGVLLVLPADTPGRPGGLRGGAELQRRRHRAVSQHPNPPPLRWCHVLRDTTGNTHAYAGVRQD